MTKYILGMGLILAAFTISSFHPVPEFLPVHEFGAVRQFDPVQKFDLKASVERGREVYMAQCIACHAEQGEGIEGIYPPLAKSDYLMADKKRSIDQILHGLTGEIKVNGKTYDGVMTGFDFLSDAELSDVLNYVRNSFGNKGPAVTPEEVKALRK